MKTYIHFLLILTAAFRLSAQPKTLLRLQAQGNGMQNEAVVYFDASAGYTYDPLLDAPSLGVNQGYLDVVTCFDSIDFQVKALPALTQGVTIPLKVTTGISGQYQVSANDLQNLPSGACVMLYDAYSGMSHDLRSGNYLCMISDTESVARFSVNIIISVLPPPASSFQNPTCASSLNGKVIAISPGTGLWNYYWKDSTNNIIRTQLNKEGNDTLGNIAAGDYHVDVNPAGTCGNSSAEFSLVGALSPTAYFTSDSVSVVHSYVQFSNTSVNAITYSWNFGDGMASTTVNAWHNYSATNVYTVSLSAFSSLCNETSTFTKILTVVGTTGLNDNRFDNAILVSRDVTGYYLQINSDIQSKTVISGYDMFGKNLFSISPQLNLNTKTYLDLEAYKNTVVLLTVSLGNEMISKKIVVE
jgi:PKD repeat protein